MLFFCVCELQVQRKIDLQCSAIKVSFLLLTMDLKESYVSRKFTKYKVESSQVTVQGSSL